MSRRVVPKFTVVRAIVVVAVVLLVASAVSWWRLVYSNPVNVFNRMLATSLSTPSVTKIVDQTDETQKLNQASTLNTTPDQIAQSLSVLQQTDGTGTSVATESIGTPTADYVRYIDIQTQQKNSKGENFDFSSVLGIWGKSSTDNALNGGTQLFNQTVLGVVPVANLPQPERGKLLDQIKQDQVFQFDTAAVKKQTVNGRPIYTYTVTVDPVAYVTMLKSFAAAIGLTQLEQVDPAQYENSPPLDFVFEVDVWSGQLRKITYGSTERVEASSSYGARIQIDEPSSAIGVEELQARLQQLQ